MKSFHSFVAAGLLFRGTTVAQPENDLCANATMLQVNGGKVNGTLEDANLLSDESHVPVCADPNQKFGNLTGAEGAVWYSVVGTGVGLVASLCNNLGAVAVYTDDCENPECISVPRLDTEGYCPEETPGVYSSWYGFEGVVYKVRVLERGVPGVPFTFEVFELDSWLPHDTCQNAMSIPSIGRVNDTYDQNVSSIDLGYPTCGAASERSGNLGTTGLWYQMTGTGKTIRVSPACGISFRTGIRVFSGNCDTLACVGDHDVSQNVCGDGFDDEDVVLVDTVEGGLYYILIENDHVGGGDFYFILDESSDQASLMGPAGWQFLVATTIVMLVFTL